MHDTLDLTALRPEAKEAFEMGAKWRKWSRYYVWILIASLITSAIVWPETMDSTLAMVLFVVIVIIIIAIIALLLFPVTVNMLRSFRQSRRAARQIEIYAQPFVKRKPRLKSISRVLMFLIPAFPIVLALINPELTAFPVIILLILFLLRNFYSSLFRWIYRGGLPRVEQFLRLLPGNYYLLSYKSTFLAREGRVSESNDIHRRLLSDGNFPNARSLSLVLNNLAAHLLMIGEYAEALPMIEAAIRISPGLGYAYDTLASWYLEQNLDPERAVELSDLALEYGGETDSVQQATNARACALTGRTTRAQVMLDKVLNVLDHVPSDEAAESSRQVAYVFLAMGQPDTARQYFQKALTLDSDGEIGKLARRALDSLQPTTS